MGNYFVEIVRMVCNSTREHNSMVGVNSIKIIYFFKFYKSTFLGIFKDLHLNKTECKTLKIIIKNK